MKNQVEFKVGDLVYCPSISLNVLEVLPVDDWQMKKKTPIRLPTINDNIVLFLTELGVDIYSKMPVIVHANQENYELLSKLHPNVEFEPPPSKEPKEIIEAMLDYGYHGVLCQITMVDEDDDNIVRCYRYDYALEVLDDKIIFSHHTMYNDELKFVSPFYQKTGMEIVDFTNGKIVLQNGEVVLED